MYASHYLCIYIYIYTLNATSLVSCPHSPIKGTIFCFGSILPASTSSPSLPLWPTRTAFRFRCIERTSWKLEMSLDFAASLSSPLSWSRCGFTQLTGLTRRWRCMCSMSSNHNDSTRLSGLSCPQLQPSRSSQEKNVLKTEKEWNIWNT